MPEIINILAREILDSRGNPTVEVDVVLECGSFGRTAVPSGASTGSFEAVEKRDEDSLRYSGKGVQTVIESIKGEIFDALKGCCVNDQMYIDQVLIELDGTPNKSRLGANALLGVSLASAKAAAESFGIPLYRYLGGLNTNHLPMPMMNIINGGAHADNQIDIQEFMVIPSSASDIETAIQMGAEIFHSLKYALKKEGYNVNVGDEGGFAPALKSTHETLDFIMKAIENVGYKPGEEVQIALDVAANELFKGGEYYLDGKKLNSERLVNFYEDLVKSYPIKSIEDGLSEEDWEGWVFLTKVLGHQLQLVGDDLFVTNKKRLLRGISENAGNAILIKPNQIGTLTETFETINLAHQKGFKTIISHRSGETEDTFIADLAVGVRAQYIKTGSLCRSERVAKYNRLIRIAEEIGESASISR